MLLGAYMYFEVNDQRPVAEATKCIVTAGRTPSRPHTFLLDRLLLYCIAYLRRDTIRYARLACAKG